MESKINKLFDSKNRRFEIPSYQRAYSWEKKQIEQFIEDLKNAGNQYYLGHFLFEIKEENVLYVIDGQQRLTTLIIFFSVLKRELENRKEKDETVKIDLSDITDYYLKDMRKGTQKFKTVLDDNNFFVEEIIEAKHNHSHELDTTSKIRIRKAKELFLKEFAETSTETLEKWCELVENATITEYIVKDKTQATQIFAFQNDRGKKLSNLEILKAYFMLQIYLSSNGKGMIEDNIVYLEDELSNIYKQIVRINLDEDEVLNYYWRAISGKGFNSDEVIKSVKEKIVSLETDKSEWIKDFVSGLSQAFQTVEKIEKSQESYVKDLFYLNNMALAYPFLIKVYHLKAEEKAINRLTKLLENITFRYLLRGGRAEIESRLNQYLVHLTAENLNKNIDDIIWRIKNDGWWGYWNDGQMKSCLNSWFYQNRVDNYVLWKYELYLCDDNHPKPHKVSFEDLIRNESIEHIAPQTPTNGDPVANGYGIYEDEENPENGIVSGEWLNRLGNLMLISKSHNSSIGNKPFDQKLKSYGEANLLNQQKEIASFVSDKDNPAWNKDTIEKRHTKILDATMDIWNLDNI
ncbi:MAG: DUF262 domain-containing HNH endonuclease family protein [Prevotellaceae bacterium]|jgi:uncharacterized protein with ParB-like and HNH nuclease domain|nr:DUF262 domain-containing HNH endonuclease family protein [Prevotellaceae bacterium]